MTGSANVTDQGYRDVSEPESFPGSDVQVNIQLRDYPGENDTYEIDDVLIYRWN